MKMYEEMKAYGVSSQSHIRVAVSGDADLVGDVDSTFSWECSYIVGIDTPTKTSGKGFQAIARRPAVHGGLGQGVEVSHSVAAPRLWPSTAAKVAKARRHRDRDTAAVDPSMCHVCTHHNHV